jgi:hypothetical protein
MAKIFGIGIALFVLFILARGSIPKYYAIFAAPVVNQPTAAQAATAKANPTPLTATAVWAKLFGN